MNFKKIILTLLTLCSSGSILSFYSGRKDIGKEELFAAIDNSDAEAVKSLLERRIDPNIFKNGKSALLTAIGLHDNGYHVVEALLEYGADLNASDDSGMTPLVFAHYLNKPDIVLLLLQHGAEVTPEKTLREEKKHKIKCPYEKALKKLEKEFLVVPEEEEEEWTIIPNPDDEWEILKSYL
jgi:ankyrin repeat protein